MECRRQISSAVLAGIILAMPSWRVQAQPLPAAPDPIRISSCSVYATKDPGNAYDCTAQAAKTCNGKDMCEIAVGQNLTDGKDIAPGSGFLGKMVTFNYQCGGAERQRGPYHQDDHATMILDCQAPE